MAHQWGTEAWYAAMANMAANWSSAAGAENAAPPLDLNYVAQYVITGCPSGVVKYYERLERGRMVAIAGGEAPAPDVTITLVYSDYQKIFTESKSSHELPSYQVTGDVAKLRPAIELRGSEGYKKYKEKLRDMTTWP